MSLHHLRPGTMFYRYPDLAVWVAQNKTVPIEILQELASHSDSRVRHMVASKRKLSTDLFRSLSVDSDESVRKAIAYNAKTPREVLESLANEDWEEIRLHVSKRLHDNR